MSVQHQFSMHTPRGERIGILSPTSASFARRVNDIGAASLILDPARHSYLDYNRDMVLVAERSVDGGLEIIIGQTLWFLRKRRLEFSSDPETPSVLILTFEDANTLLRRRIVAYYATEPETDKADLADNMIVEVMRENFGNLAIPARDWSAFLSVSDSPGLGPYLEKEFAWQDCLRTIQDIARTSENLGTDLFFDILCVRPPGPGGASPSYSLGFHTFANLRGIDHRFPGGRPPVILGPERGNLMEAVLEDDWLEEETHIYAGGEGVDILREVEEAEDAGLVGASPIGRIEGWKDVRDMTDAANVTTEAQAALQQRIARTRLSGTFVDGVGARWGIDLGFGDLVTAQAGVWGADCRLDVESYAIDRDRGEDIKVQMTGLVNG